MGASVADRIAAFQAKVRHVRTPEGARRFGEPIGAVILDDGSVRLPSTGRGSRDMPEKHPRGEHQYGEPSGDPNKFPGMKLATDNDKAAYKARTGKAIPPAWTEVYIAKDPDAKLQVKGKDGKGRMQSVYSAAHTEEAAEKKFTRIQAFAPHLTKIDKGVEKDALDNDDAAALAMIRRLGMRPGSNRNTGADKEAHGATNLKRDHVKLSDDGESFELDFTGKKGVHIQLSVKDKFLYSILKKRLDEDDTPGVQIFNTNEDRTRSYMKSLGVPDEFLLKDLRTVHANKVALREIAKRGDSQPKSLTEYRKWRKEIGTLVSSELGNTPTLALASYINPTVFTPWRVDPTWS